jgi:nitrile hydratase subunit alpha
MTDSHTMVDQPASTMQRAKALEAALTANGLLPDGFVDDFNTHAEEQWVTRNGAQIVARAWTDPAFRARLLQDGKSAAAEMGFGMPEHHRHLVVLENTPDIHNLIVCTLCSCTAYTIIGAAPDWYKDLEYRARVVRESRTALKEIWLDLPATTEIRVWDTTADTRYMVLPVQPAATQGRSAEKLADIVTQESLIGTARLDTVGG